MDHPKMSAPLTPTFLPLELGGSGRVETFDRSVHRDSEAGSSYAASSNRWSPLGSSDELSYSRLQSCRFLPTGTSIEVPQPDLVPRPLFEPPPYPRVEQLTLYSPRREHR